MAAAGRDKEDLLEQNNTTDTATLILEVLADIRDVLSGIEQRLAARDAETH